ACSPLAQTSVTRINLTSNAPVIYPDLPNVQALTNAAVDEFYKVRGAYDEICKIKDLPALKSAVEAKGGPAFLISKIDSDFNPALDKARNAVRVAIENPAATITPTFTPSLPATFTPGPTSTPGPSP